MKVSVIIPVFNAETFVETAVHSALMHDEVREILLVEDGSHDNSLEICRDLEAESENVHLFRHPGGINKGAGATRNLGIEKATMKFISFLDADDYMTDRRYTKEKKLFAQYPDIDGVYGATGTKIYDSLGEKAWKKKGFTENFLTTVNKPVPPEDLFNFLTGFSNKNQYDGHFSIDGLTVKRQALLNHRIRFNESLKVHQDTYFIWHCAYALTLMSGEISRPVAMRGVHRNNRFIHIKNYNRTRALFYRAIMRWAKKERLNKKYRYLFSSEFHNLSADEKGILSMLYHSFQKYKYQSYLNRGHTIDYTYLLLKDMYSALLHRKS